ncbi:MAG: hypothetical protein RIC55_26500 [Pirellulaceae bacterium]
MHSTPFRFLDSPESLRGLRQALGEVGLSEVVTAAREATDETSEPNPYQPACLRFACRWLSESVEIHWRYYWWPDGMYSELGRVSVVYEGVVRGEVNVEELLQQQVGRPLAEVIIEAIVAACAEVTGKRGPTSKCSRPTGSSTEPGAAADGGGVPGF